MEGAPLGFIPSPGRLEQHARRALLHPSKAAGGAEESGGGAKHTAAAPAHGGGDSSIRRGAIDASRGAGRAFTQGLRDHRYDAEGTV
ncbi:uncharacterized protein LOC144720786 isoform X2 [Lampetra planeri]